MLAFSRTLKCNELKERRMAQTERLVSLQAKHAQLERELDDEFQRPKPNSETVTRLKRAKLRLKDEMAQMSLLH